MAKVYLGLGSNIDSERNLRVAARELRRVFGELELSPVYQSKSVGFDGADFLNLVVGFESDMTPEEIQAEIERIHDLAGRRRGQDKYSSRPLDIDLLMYDDLVRAAPRPPLPRADILEYGFVLQPLADLAPDLVHPQTGRSMRDHWHQFDRGGQPLMRVNVIL